MTDGQMLTPESLREALPIVTVEAFEGTPAEGFQANLTRWEISTTATYAFFDGLDGQDGSPERWAAHATFALHGLTKGLMQAAGEIEAVSGGRTLADADEHRATLDLMAAEAEAALPRATYGDVEGLMKRAAALHWVKSILAVQP